MRSLVVAVKGSVWKCYTKIKILFSHFSVHFSTKSFFRDYGLSGGTLHVKMIVCLNGSRCLGWVLGSLMRTLLLSASSLLWSWLFEMLHLLYWYFPSDTITHQVCSLESSADLKRCEMVWSPSYSWLAGLSASHRHLSKRAEGFMKGCCCHFTGGKQKSEACKACAEADCGSALIGCAKAKMSNNTKSPRSVSLLNNTLTEVT